MPLGSPRASRISRIARFTAVAAGVIGLITASAISVDYAWRRSDAMGTLRDRLHLGGVLANGRSKTLDRLGLEVHRLGCRAGDARSCTNAGRVFDEGWGVTRDVDEANRFYANGCFLGDGFGCFYLGVAHEMGDGVPKEPREACFLYRDACKLREEYGCYRAGVCEDLGLSSGEPKPTLAAAYYEVACEGGSASACAAMGMRAAEADPMLAAAYFRRACADGNATGCRGLRALSRR